MTYYLRFRPGGPDDAYRGFDGAGIVSLAFALTDWWVQWRDQTRSAAETLRRARAVPFSLTLLVAIDSGIALSADAPASLVCGGDYVCIADAPMPLPAAMRIESLQGRQSPADAGGVADSNRCTEGPIDVMVSSPEERALVCAAAADAIRLLDRCRIAPRWALRVEVMPEVRHPLGRIVLGLLDTKRQRILVTQAANIAALIEETPYAALPQDAFYRSLIVHEVVHAVMDQNLKRPASSHAAYEYPAYALQIESLGPEERDIFLNSFDQAALVSDALFNDPVLFFDPYLFAARAYHHFKRSPDGCAHLNGLLQGGVGFIVSLEMQ
jgi:hypothetical protein